MSGAEQLQAADDGQRVTSADPLKPWRNLQAEASLAGIVAHLGQDDAGRPEITFTRWALTKSFSDVADARAWLQRVVGKAA